MSGLNLNIILIDIDVSQATIDEFNELLYENKMILVETSNTQKYHNVFEIQGMKPTDSWFTYQHGLSLKKFYDNLTLLLG